MAEGIHFSILVIVFRPCGRREQDMGGVDRPHSCSALVDGHVSDLMNRSKDEVGRDSETQPLSPFWTAHKL